MIAVKPILNPMGRWHNTDTWSKGDMGTLARKCAALVCGSRGESSRVIKGPGDVARNFDATSVSARILLSFGAIAAAISSRPDRRSGSLRELARGARSNERTGEGATG